MQRREAIRKGNSLCKNEEGDIFSPMIPRKKPGKPIKKVFEKEPVDSLQQQFDNEARHDGFAVGPVWHGSPDFVGDTFDMKYLGRLSGISRGGINFTKDKARAEAYRDAIFSDNEQTVIDDAVQMVNDARRETELTKDQQECLAKETGWDWEAMWFGGRFVDDWEDFKSMLTDELAPWFKKHGKTQLADAMVNASQLENREQKPKLRRAFLKNPRIEIQNRTGEAVYIVDDVSQIREVPEMQYSIEDPEFKEWFGNSKVVDEQGKPLKVYHLERPVIDCFKIPSFFTSEKSGAEWYKYDRGDEDGVITEAYLCFENPFFIDRKESAMAFIDLARRAGVEITLSEDEHGWTFEAPEIRQHSPYEGHNINDLVYIPAVRGQLFDEGYDGIVASDVLENTEIDIYIAIAPGMIRALPSTSRW